MGQMNSQIQELSAMTGTINNLQDRIGRLVNENTGM